LLFLQKKYNFVENKATNPPKFVKVPNMAGRLKDIRQERFCQHYVKTGNLPQSMIDAGYSDNYAKKRGHELLDNVGIQGRIEELRDKVEVKFDISRERVLAEYAKIAFMDVRKMFNDNGQPLGITELDDNTVGAIAGIEVLEEKVKGETVGYVKKYRLADKKGALDSICKVMGYNEPEKRNINLKVDNLSSLSDAELADLIKE
jgi:phage terminase small subunit